MALNFTPKVGQILECNYGDYQRTAAGELTNHVDGHIHPEMVKHRLVVVLNGKLSPTSCIVVPLSTTYDRVKTNTGFHVELDENTIQELNFFKPCKRWAKADMVEQVSKERLYRPNTPRGRAEIYLDRATVELIQRAVVKGVSASGLLK